MGTDVLDLRKLVVVLLLHLLSVRLRGLIDATDEVFELVHLIKKFFPERIIRQVDLLFDIILVVLNQLVNLFHMLDGPLVI